MTDASDSRPPLKALTGLRFCAALWVVSHHYLVLPPQAGPLNEIIRLGPKAVLLFFILSGFILTYVYAGHSKGVDLGTYFRARFARIYPLYALGIALGLPIALLTPEGHYIREHIGVALATFLTGTQAWYPFDPLLQLNGPLWSLSVEMFFYALFPLMAPLCYAAARRKTPAIVLSGVALACYVVADRYCYAAAGLLYPEASAPGFTWGWHPVVNLPLFVLGMLLGGLYLRHGWKWPSQKKSIGLLGDLLLLTMVAGTAFSERLAGAAVAALFVSLFSIGIFWFACARSPLSHALASPPVQLLGNASYALYIVHAPLWHFYEFAYTDIFRIGSASTTVFRVSYLCVAIVASILIYQWLEVPIRDRLRGRRGRG